MAKRGILREGRSARQRRAPAEQGLEGSHPEGLGHVGPDAGEGRRDGRERKQTHPGRDLYQQVAQDRARQERHEGGGGQGEKDGRTLSGQWSRVSFSFNFNTKLFQLNAGMVLKMNFSSGCVKLPAWPE